MIHATLFREQVLPFSCFLLRTRAVFTFFDVKQYRPFVMTKLSCGPYIRLHCSLKYLKHLKGVQRCLTEFCERRQWLKKKTHTHTPVYEGLTFNCKNIMLRKLFADQQGSVVLTWSFQRSHEWPQSREKNRLGSDEMKFELFGRNFQRC